MFVRSLSIGVAAAALLAGGAQAADLIIPTAPQPIYEAAGFSWDGMYAGVRAGGSFFDSNSDDISIEAIGDDTNTLGVLGAAVGVNFIVADPILLGAEVTADYVFSGDDNDDHFGEFFATSLLFFPWKKYYIDTHQLLSKDPSQIFYFYFSFPQCSFPRK